ncbi:MAG: methionine adenosyltransferase [Holdemanella sp.]|nr:methionine adenosyltransferase [Holdemanella sp.]
MKDFIFTSESITEGHPDKICDKIADSILDEALRQDPESKMAVEATIKDDFVLIYGECNTKAKLDYEKIAKETIKKIGYTEDYTVMVKVNKQSAEINNAVVNHENEEVGAGDQGIMFGYACDETKEYMPAPIYYAHMLALQLTRVRKNGNTDIKPDGKTQVSVEYKDNKVSRIDTIVVSTQHSAAISQEDLKKLIMEEIIKPCINESLVDENTKYLINPSGSFVLGGSFGDSGTTGRKIVCDTYGGWGRIGGGCFSSKDASKVDRSAAYYCRYVAKNIVANGLAKRAEVEVAYAIGKSRPVSICVDTFGTGIKTDEELLEIIKKNFNFEVGNIIRELDLKKPIFEKTSCYGHFGDPQFTWEKIKKLAY